MGTVETSKEMPSGLTINIAKGEIKLEDLLNWISSYYSGITTKYILWDFNEADLSNITTEEIRKIAKEVKKKSDIRAGGKTALVFNGDLDFGLGRMYEAFAEIEGIKFESMSFQNIAEARKWLGV